MKIIIDTREPKSMAKQFIQYNIVSDIINEALPEGDYGCEFEGGERSNTIFERKAFSDLFGTMGKGYPRFKKEMNRAAARGTRLVLIIEGTIGKVIRGYDMSALKGYSVCQKLFTLWFRHGLMPVFCRDKPELVRYIVEYYSAEGREKFLNK